jgi:hypothetical protein
MQQAIIRKLQSLLRTWSCTRKLLLVSETRQASSRLAALQQLDVQAGLQNFLLSRSKTKCLWTSPRVRFPFSDSNLHSKSAIEFHAFAPLDASRRVTNDIPPGCHFRLTLEIPSKH